MAAPRIRSNQVYTMQSWDHLAPTIRQADPTRPILLETYQRRNGLVKAEPKPTPIPDQERRFDNNKAVQAIPTINAQTQAWVVQGRLEARRPKQ